MIPDPYVERRCCRSCGSTDLLRLFDLGQQALSDFVAPGQPDPISAPLQLGICGACQLVQLLHTVDPALLYSQRYWYQSGINTAMVEELADVMLQAVKTVGGVGPNDIVVDVGANDGTGLAQYAAGKQTPYRVAFEPAALFKERLIDSGVNLICQTFFPSLQSRQLIADRSVKILTSIAMFYDLDDPRSFVEEVDRVLTEDGLWVVQMQDLGQMVRKTAFDNLCFEHLCYYSIKTFNALLQGTGLAIVQIDTREINGGSLRFSVRRMGQRHFQDLLAVADQLDQESAWLTHDALEQFVWRARTVRAQLFGVLDHARKFGPIDLYGASTKANTLLQWCGLDTRIFRQAVERSPAKWGLETPKTRIPIVSEAVWREDPALTTMIGIWAFKPGILKREAEYFLQGGTWIVPLPRLEIIRGS